LIPSPSSGTAGPSLEPFGDEPVAGVDVYLTEPALAGVGELVRHAGWNDHDLATFSLYGLVSGRNVTVPSWITKTSS
jgi:hypothetical protein